MYQGHGCTLYVICFTSDDSHHSHAKQLIEDTIRRNASPVRLEQPDKERMGGSSSSLNSSASDESNRFPGTFWFIVFSFDYQVIGCDPKDQLQTYLHQLIWYLET